MKKLVSAMVIAVAMACAACAPAEDTKDGSTTTADQVFPESLQFVTPAGVK